jgi:hypothetical protein
VKADQVLATIHAEPAADNATEPAADISEPTIQDPTHERKGA